MRLDGEELALLLDPAFVQHWEYSGDTVRGVGRWQRVLIRVSGIHSISSFPTEPTTLRGGWIQADGVRYDDLMPVPLRVAGPVEGFLEQEDDFPKTIRFLGAALTIELAGTPEGAEPLPIEWAPTDH